VLYLKDIIDFCCNMLPQSIEKTLHKTVDIRIFDIVTFSQLYFSKNYNRRTNVVMLVSEILRNVS